VERGARAGSPADLARDCDAIVVSLPGPREVRAVLLDPGFVQALRPGSVVIDTSTVDPSLSAELARVLDTVHAHAVDAPVSGGQRGAEDGVLSSMVGGTTESFELARSVLDVFCARVLHVGPPGAGQVTKAANQIIVAGTIGIVGEALAVLRSGSVDVPAAIEAIGGGLAGSEILRRKTHALLTDDFEPGFRIDLHVKDLGIALDLARDGLAPLPIAALVTQLMISNQAHGEGSLDHSALIKTTRRLASDQSTHVG
jgi:2-hydroxy-3-oxopropionate reductase